MVGSIKWNYNVPKSEKVNSNLDYDQNNEIPIDFDCQKYTIKRVSMLYAAFHQLTK